MSNEGKDNLGYIGENKKSNEDDIQPPTSNYDGGINDNEPNTNPIVDVMSADFITKPFSIAAGTAKIPHSKFNPFRKKSGLLNVLAKQSKVSLIIINLKKCINFLTDPLGLNPIILKFILYLYREVALWQKMVIFEQRLIARKMIACFRANT